MTGEPGAISSAGLLTLVTTRGPACEAAGKTLIPVARALLLRAPAGIAALVWSRPAAVEVLAAGERRLLRIEDTTRRIQWLLLGAGLAAGLLLRWRRR
jgi:hypothetical protein